MLEFVDSGLYFVQDKNDFINPLLQVGSGSRSVEKITGSGSDPHPCFNDRDRIPVNLFLMAGEARSDMPGANHGPAPVMRVFGVTETGNSICVHIHGFHPYLFIPAPAGFTKDHLSGFR